MTTIEHLVTHLQARGIVPQDLEETIMALLKEAAANYLGVRTVDARSQLLKALGTITDTLSSEGLHAQLTWLRAQYEDMAHLEWALAGYLNLPIAA